MATIKRQREDGNWEYLQLTGEDVNTLKNDFVTHLADKVQHITATERTSWNGKYTKPSTGIPKTDLASGVQTSLNKADTAVQPSNIGNYAGKIVTGSYVGDGTTGRVISIGVTAKIVFILSSDGNYNLGRMLHVMDASITTFFRNFSNNLSSGGYIYDSRIVTNGMNLDSTSYLNVSGMTYYYYAFV